MIQTPNKHFSKWYHLSSCYQMAASLGGWFLFEFFLQAQKNKCMFLNVQSIRCRGKASISPRLHGKG